RHPPRQPPADRAGPLPRRRPDPRNPRRPRRPPPHLPLARYLQRQPVTPNKRLMLEPTSDTPPTPHHRRLRLRPGAPFMERSDMSGPAQSPGLQRPIIGVFDSGFGGLTVLHALLSTIAGAHFLYIGDTARLPYGAKSRATVARYAVESARLLESRGA